MKYYKIGTELTIMIINIQEKYKNNWLVVQYSPALANILGKTAQVLETGIIR